MVLFTSCEDEKKAEKASPKSIAFESKIIERSVENCSPSEANCTYIQLDFPVAKTPERSAKKINRQIEDFLQNTIDYQEENSNSSPEEIAEEFIGDYEENAEDFPEYQIAWEASITGKLISNQPGLISIEFRSHMFTGGAHGYQSVNYLNFDPKTGDLLKSNELFSPEFSSLVERDFREKHGIPVDENINSTGLFFENDQFQLPHNIGITEGKVILHYNSYEIAPYSSGNFVLSYQISDIKDFIKFPKPEL
ncbi:hypothetical protein LPB144_09855 [Christiangramia salexigens]|uniref:Deacetylase PdaC domain-containing protein n=1 Tax=Christiangramia salexigens TaxID=1913577 RepID=A0A1L3J8M7_9FLAO|nr:hypothetical protein LPB144_09855 [Christiangramia salexigens]